MHVIAHEDVGVNRNVVNAYGVRQIGEVILAIFRRSKYRRAVVPTLDDVQHDAGVEIARLAGHRRQIACRRSFPLSAESRL